MYGLPYYNEKNDEVIEQFIDEHPFAFLAGCDAETYVSATWYSDPHIASTWNFPTTANESFSLISNTKAIE